MIYKKALSYVTLCERVGNLLCFLTINCHIRKGTPSLPENNFKVSVSLKQSLELPLVITLITKGLKTCSFMELNK